MSRTLSLVLRTAMNAQESGLVPIFLVTIDHDDLASPIRMSTDPTERVEDGSVVYYRTVSRDESFVFTACQFVLPDEGEGRPGVAKLVFSNVNREAIELLRSVDTPADVKVELVTTDDLDTVETTWPRLKLAHASYDASTITLDLTLDPLMNEPFPAHDFTPAHAPGLFR